MTANTYQLSDTELSHSVPNPSTHYSGWSTTEIDYRIRGWVDPLNVIVDGWDYAGL